MTSLTQKDALRTLISAASPARRRLFAKTIGMMLFGAFAELATIGAVLPFLAIATKPDLARGYPFIGALFDSIGGGRYGVILASAALLILIGIGAGIVRMVLVWFSMKFALLYGHDVGCQVFARMLRQPYSEVVMRNSSITLASIDKLNVVIFNLLIPGMQGLAAALISLFIITGLFFIDAFVAAVAGLFLGGTYAIVTLATRKRLRRNSATLGATTTARIQVLQEGFGGIRDILIDNSQSVFEASFAELDYRNRSAMAVNNMIAVAPRYIVETAVISMIALFTIYFASRPGGLIAAVPVLGALAIGAQRLLPQVHAAYNGWSAFASSRQMLIDIAVLLRNPVVAMGDLSTRDPIVPFAGTIEVDGITFGYVDREYALRDVSLTIAKGERVGFVGPTGSGKSTLIDLLMGLLPPSHGEMRIDGVVLGEENMASWQAQIAHVPQAIYLSDGSIAANIAFGVPAAAVDAERLRDAARQADIDDFIMKLPEGYATTVGERGVRLSGGQRQRIGIARALYKGARVLIFDEATSALDERTEMAIMESIYRLDRDVTLLMIAHRVSTLAGCDRIVLLKQGQIVDIRQPGYS